MSPHCWGEWLLERAGDGLPYPDEHEPMPVEEEEEEEDSND